MGLRTSVVAASVVAAPYGSGPVDGETLDSNALKNAEFRFAVQNSTRKFALNCTLAFIFFRFSFLHEYLASRFGIAAHFLLILGALSYVACFLGGTALTGFKYRPILMWTLFGGCMCVATLTSTWRGGSVNVLLPYLRTTLPLVLLIPALVYTQ